MYIGHDETGNSPRRTGTSQSDVRAETYDGQFASTLVITASIIAAVRLARDAISRPSPRLTSVVTDSVRLARMILDSVVR